MTVTVKTNNVPRDLILGTDITNAERLEFDYIRDDQLEDCAFFRYKGRTYYIGEFTRPDTNGAIKEWDGFHSDTYFSGTVIRYTEDDRVICGTYRS